MKNLRYQSTLMEMAGPRLLQTLAATLLTTTLSGCALGAAEARNDRVSAAIPRGAIYTFESDASGFNTKNFFYDNGEEVVAFDTQFTPAIAQKSIQFLRTKTSHPITFVVITHPNPDKYNGIPVFQNLGARIILSKQTQVNMPIVHAYKKNYFVNVAKMFSEDQYPRLPQVNQSFESTYDIVLHNGEVIHLEELGRPGVSTNQTVADIPSQNVLVVGDLIHENAHAWLEGGIVQGRPVPTLSDWTRDLQTLQMRYGGSRPLVLGGRGDAVELNEGINKQIKYLQRADGIVSQYVERLGSRRSELLNDQAGAHYLAIQKEFEASFPEYKLGYMIQYGVYGLVNSKL